MDTMDMILYTTDRGGTKRVKRGYKREGGKRGKEMVEMVSILKTILS